jgi:hypothetical protein
VKICLCTSNLERRERNSRDMDFTCSRTRCLDHISGQDSRPKKWDLYTLSNVTFHCIEGVLSAQVILVRNALMLSIAFTLF